MLLEYDGNMPVAGKLNKMGQFKRNIEVIHDLQKSGALKSLVSSGLFPAKVIYQMEIYSYVMARMEAGGKKTQAVKQASVNFGIDDSTIYRILKSFSASF